MSAPAEVIERLQKILAMTGSAHEGEKLAAIGRANEMLARHKLTWSKVFDGECATQATPRLVAAGTRCRLRVHIPRGADGVLTRSHDPKSQARYLLCAFTVTAPERFAGMSFRDRFGTHGKDGQPTGYYAEQGRHHLKRMALSAGIELVKPNDLDGIEVVALVGIRQRSFKNADGESENHIKEILVPGDPAYQDGGAA